MALATLCLTLPGTSSAQPQPPGSGDVAGRAHVYVDDDNTTIGTGLVDGNVALPADFKVGAHALVDVISSASVDVVSNASVDVVSAASAGFTELRVEFGGRAGYFITPELDIGAGFTWSSERDWKSYTPSATFGLDLFKRNLRLTGSYAYGFNDIRQAHEPSFRERKHTHTAEVGVSQLLDDKTLVGVAYTFQGVDGFQSSPYRRIPVADRRLPLIERHPTDRLRHAVTFRGLRYLGGDLAVLASYRIYADDWGVQSNAVATSWFWDLSELVQLRFFGRGYHQRAAGFWREQYAAPAEYLSGDRELSTLWDVSLGLGTALHFGDWTLDARADGLYYRYLNFALLDHRWAFVGGLGGRFEW
ncbi:MAG: DUF3570 domain-containing protein [Deltaproteobacteria bacterium]|nr:DUF3570 domain-containing protein [Deltaproteobacteria bacterium]